MKTQRERIDRHIADHKPTVISINYVPDGIEPDYIFLSNAKRYVQLATRLSQGKYVLIATSNVTGTNGSAFDYVLNFSTLMDAEARIVDNSLVMLLKALKSAGCTKVTLAGFDGYSGETSNYYNVEMEYDFAQNMAEYLNEYTTAFLESIRDDMEVIFLTDSRYRQQPRQDA